MFGLTGALKQIDWSRSNQVSININKKKPSQTRAPPDPVRSREVHDNRVPARPASSNGLSSSRSHDSSSYNDITDVPINRYKSVVAPVKG